MGKIHTKLNEKYLILVTGQQQQPNNQHSKVIQACCSPFV